MLSLSVQDLISRIIVLVIAFSVHEFAHAFVANAYGDDTPRLNGRLTLNPLAHLDLMGSLLLVFAGFGWARPVPVNPYALSRRSSAALMLVALAGPMSNLGLAILAAIPLRLGLVPFSFSSGFLPSLFEFTSTFIIINLALMLFNLLPIAPLDGDKIAEYFLPPPFDGWFQTIRPYGPIILLAIVFLPRYVGLDIIGAVIGPALRNLYSFLVGV